MGRMEIILIAGYTRTEGRDRAQSHMEYRTRILSSPRPGNLSNMNGSITDEPRETLDMITALHREEGVGNLSVSFQHLPAGVKEL